MLDQAQRLREVIGNKVAEYSNPKTNSRGCRVIAITSGKGGVGKTSVVGNLAVTLAKKGRRVCIFDADLGLANIDILFGLTPRYTLQHVIFENKSIEEIMVAGPANVKILPASSGIQEMSELTGNTAEKMLKQLEVLDREFDILLIDTAAGISNNVIHFAAAAQELIVIVTPDPTSITDAYAVIKVLISRVKNKRIGLLANFVGDIQEANELYARMKLVVGKFLKFVPDYAGYVLYDENMSRAVREQTPLVEKYPSSVASRCIETLAEKIIDPTTSFRVPGGIKFFWKRMLNLLSADQTRQQPK